MTPDNKLSEAVFQLRKLNIDDAEEVQKLEYGVSEFPWSLKQFKDSIQGKHQCYCARSEHGIIAYSVVEKVGAECSLLNIAVKDGWQRRGLGRWLLTRVLQKLADQGGSHCVLEVRVSNTAAIDLYYDLGFFEVGQRPAYYPAKAGREDALVLFKPLEETTSESIEKTIDGTIDETLGESLDSIF